MQEREPEPPAAEQPATGRYHDHLLELYRDKTSEISRLIVSLAGGAFGLSIAFLEKITGGRFPKSEWMIVSSWWFLAFSLLFTLLSVWMSAVSMLRAAEQLYPRPGEPVARGTLGGLWAWLVNVFTPTAIILLVAGLVLLALFAIANLPVKPGPT